jgi:hypothetical protein
MRRTSKPKEVHETTTDVELDRVYHEIRQTLRVSGVPLVFRVWARRKKFLLALWDGLRPNAETRTFERAADHLRAQAVEAASGLALPESLSPPSLGESQRHQIQAALELYRYINPKLLLLTSTVCLALDDERIGQTGLPDVELIERGIPSTMLPMELVLERMVEPRVQRLLADIGQTLELMTVDDDYRTLALWPDYLFDAWTRLKALVVTPEYDAATTLLRESARRRARTLTFPVLLTRARVTRLGEPYDEIVADAGYFEHVIPSLLLNNALLGFEWAPADVLVQSPYPPASRLPPREQEPSRGAA